MQDTNNENDNHEEDLKWTSETETYLLQFIEKYPPFGFYRHLNLLNIASCLRKFTGKRVKEEDVYAHLKLFYDIDSKVFIILRITSHFLLFDVFRSYTMKNHQN
jgi:hypothetical protein